jgi:hypothetical protein
MLHLSSCWSQCAARATHRLDRAAPVARVLSEFLVARCAHSHSGSQFLQHLPQHWNSIILPPHCGQTRFMIDEMRLALGSPGRASMIFMDSPPFRGFCRKGFDDARCSRRLRMSVNLRPVSFSLSTLRAGWLRVPSLPCTDCRLAVTLPCKHDAVCKIPILTMNTTSRRYRRLEFAIFCQAFGK